MSPISNTDIFQDFQKLATKNSKSSLIGLESTVKQFKNWLSSKKLSAVSIKNYVSDTNQFLNWLEKLPSSSQDFTNYIGYLSEQDTPRPPSLRSGVSGLARSTINRKLSSLRRFATFLHVELSKPDFSPNIQNIPQDLIENLIKNFKYYLKNNGHKSKTITNYLLDIKHYLVWATAQTN